MYFVFCILIMVVLARIVIVNFELERRPNKDNLFVGDGKNIINEKEAMLYSNLCIEKSIREKLKDKEVLELVFSNDNGRNHVIYKNDGVRQILKKIRRYQNTTPEFFEDRIDNIVFGFWSEYGEYEEYRKLLGKYLNELYEAQDVSTHDYNQIAKRMYRFPGIV